jgi:Spy/CpxP family protein refolding chaperone
MKRIGMAIIAVFFISGLAVDGAGAQMAGGRGKDHGMGMGMGSRGGMGMWDGAHAMYVINALGLEDNQSAEVKSILLQLQKEMIKKRADIQVAEVELKEILDKDPVDVKTAEIKVKQIASLKTEAAMMHIQGIEDVKAKLTPEQKKKLAEMMQMRGMGYGNGWKDCPMIKGQYIEKKKESAAPLVKSRSKKTAPPVSTQ